MNVIYKNTLSVENYCLLRKSVGFYVIPEKLVKLALEKSDFIISAFINDIPVGMGRLITDGTQVLIMDVIVHPYFQKKGIGRTLMKYILDFVKNMDYTQIFVQLLTENNKIGFYEKSGFSKASTEGAEGMWLEFIKDINT